MQAGTRLGPYEVLGLIGAGGMGEVYKARDIRLDRNVAIKVLPSDFSADELRRARFAREATTIAALTHPHICTLYDVGEHAGSMFLVMEHLEGATLAHRLARGSLPMEQAVTVATEIADALAAAHRQGIIHRDLKPANVMLTNVGAKLLDFGLAKLIDPGDRAAPVQHLFSNPTCTALTGEGAIVGTLQYMSPEQLEGKPADARSDLWAFGTVVYEMLTGKPAFDATSAAALVAAILQREPSALSVLQPLIPPGLDRLVRQCLAKVSDDRPDTAHDVASELRRIRDGNVARAVAAVQRRPYPVKAALVVAAIGLVWLTGAGLLAPRFASDVSVEGRPRNSGVPDHSDESETVFDAISKSAYAYERASTSQQDASSSQPVVSQLTARAGLEMFPSLSPDGKWIVYTGDAEGNYDIYLQSVSGQLPINLTKDSSANDHQPAFSPDGEQIAFRSEREGGGVFVMGLTGESVRKVSKSGFHPNWSPDGQSLAFSPVSVSLSPHFLNAARLGAGGYLGIVDLRDEMKRFLPGIDGFQPAWSPKGDRIAFSRMSAPDGQMDIWTVPATGGEPVPVTSDRAVDWNPVWSPSGDYLYFSSDRGGTMNVWRVQLDPQSRSAMSRPEALRLPSPYVAHLSIAQNARTMAFTAALPTLDVQRAAFDPARETLRWDFSSASTGGTRFFGWGGVHVAPDMKTIAFSTFFPMEQIFTARPDFTSALELTKGGVADRHPRWAPNGEQIAFYSERNGAPNIWIIRRDGTRMRQLTDYKTSEMGPVLTLVWSPDGAYVAFAERKTRRVVIAATTQSGNKPPLRFMPAPDDADGWFEPSSWSQDGKWIAGHFANRSRGIGIYSTESLRYEPVAQFGEWPVWLNDNRRLLFSARGKLYIVDRRKKIPQELLSVRGEAFRDINVSPDNREVLFVRQAVQADIWLVRPSQQ